MKKCPNCGFMNADFNSFCESCGVQIPGNTSEYLDESDNKYDSSPMNMNSNMNSNYNSGYNSNRDSNTHYTTESDKVGTQALVFGILSIFCCSIIFGPLAIIKGNEANTGMGNAGKILGIIGLALWALGLLGRIFLG